MQAVTPPAASMMNTSPRNCSKSTPYKKLITGMPIHAMASAVTPVTATMTAMITTMIRSNRLRFAGSAHTFAIFTSSGL